MRHLKPAARALLSIHPNPHPPAACPSRTPTLSSTITFPTCTPPTRTLPHPRPGGEWRLTRASLQQPQHKERALDALALEVERADALAVREAVAAMVHEALEKETGVVLTDVAVSSEQTRPKVPKVRPGMLPPSKATGR